MSDQEIKKILEKSKTIAMVGVSSEKKGEDPKKLKRKPANVVMKYMQDFGYKVYPINPFAVGEVINGETVYEHLTTPPANNNKESKDYDMLMQEILRLKAF